MEKIARKLAGRLRTTRKSPPPGKSAAALEFLEPMKALGVTAIPAGKWLCEVKFDGYRAEAVVGNGRVEMWSRNHKSLIGDYAEIAGALKKLKCKDAILDGEIVALDASGRSRFQLLQGRDLGERPTIVYYLFDLLRLNGASLVEEPIELRRRELKKLLGPTNPLLRFSRDFNVTPAVLLAEAVEKGFEGIIAKAPGSRYEVGRRSGTWLKCKVTGEQEFVIGGFTPPQNSRPFFGALLLGYYAGGKLRYAGKVGSGFNHQLLGALHAEFTKKITTTVPFTDLPRAGQSRFGRGMTASEMKEVTWVRPKWVAQIRFTEWTSDGLLRQPVFLGLRHDKAAKDVRREAGPGP